MDLVEVALAQFAFGQVHSSAPADVEALHGSVPTCSRGGLLVTQVAMSHGLLAPAKRYKTRSDSVVVGCGAGSRSPEDSGQLAACFSSSFLVLSMGHCVAGCLAKQWRHTCAK